MRNITIIILLFVFTGISYSQKDTSEHESFLDKLSKVVEVRKSFDSHAETAKHALFSYKKDEGEDAIYTIEAAVLYEGFTNETIGIMPAIEFEYTSSDKKRRELLEVGLVGFYYLYDNKDGSGKIEPSITFGKDFIKERELLRAKLIFNPTIKNFFIPIRNIDKHKFKYNDKDDHWVWGFNPLLGFGYEYDINDNGPDETKKLYNIAHGSLSFKKYYAEVTAYGQYDHEFEETQNSNYKYGGIFTYYMDSKERTSFNAKIERHKKREHFNTEVSFGFGLGL